MYIYLLFLIIIIYYFSNIIEYFDDDIYNYKYSEVFKKMFLEPTIWLGYTDFDGNENFQKLFINNYISK